MDGFGLATLKIEGLMHISDDMMSYDDLPSKYAFNKFKYNDDILTRKEYVAEIIKNQSFF